MKPKDGLKMTFKTPRASGNVVQAWPPMLGKKEFVNADRGVHMEPRRHLKGPEESQCFLQGARLKTDLGRRQMRKGEKDKTTALY